MSLFAFLLLCVHACLAQNAFNQLLRPAGLIGRGYSPEFRPATAIPVASTAAALAPYPLNAANRVTPMGIPCAIEGPKMIDLGYGGTGIGDLAVVGELPVAGTALIAGQVPVLGTVRFAGEMPAAGTVVITGSCGCGRSRPYYR